jgi:hypothetical protein
MCNTRASKIKRAATQLIENRKAMTLYNRQQTTMELGSFHMRRKPLRQAAQKLSTFELATYHSSQPQ